MPVRKILAYGNEALRKKSRTVKKITDEEKRLLDDMALTMVNSKGLGLAAPQIGVNKRVIVCLAGDDVLKLVNPRITRKKGSIVIKEGCLSFPGIFADIKRAREVEVYAYNEIGKGLKIKAGELLARVLQHEIDHLNGILICDRVNFVDRIKLRKSFKELKKTSEKTSGKK